MLQRVFIIVIVLVILDTVVMVALLTVPVSKVQKMDISIDVSVKDVVEDNTSFSYGWFVFNHSGFFQFYWHTTTFNSARLSIMAPAGELVYSSSSPVQTSYGSFVIPEYYAFNGYDFVVIEDQNSTHVDTVVLSGTLIFSGPLL